MKAYLLKPLSPFHIQNNSANHESVENFVKSDTLSSALMHIWSLIHGEIPGLPENLPFKVSSIFPAIENNGKIIKLFPKTKTLTFDWFKENSKNGLNEPNHKAWKKVAWMDEQLFRKSIENPTELKSFLPEIIESSIWLSDKQSPKSILLFKTDERTRVVIDRVHASATPFHFITVMYAPTTRLFFLADVQKEYEAEFETVLRVLGDEGLGGDKTLGMGRFEVQSIESFALPTAKNPNAYMCLGLLNPSKEEQVSINWEASNYTIVNRRGWVSKLPLRRKATRMLDDASIVVTNMQLKGRILEVLNPNDTTLPAEVASKLKESGLSHPIYRDGRTILIPMSV